MARQPNIIWIMSDDLSWGDIGCFGQGRIKTPNIDRLAAEGMRFTGCHSGSTVCAPSRSSLMQGLHQGHATVRYNMARTSGGHVYRHSLQPGDTTVAQVLKHAGYATGLFGKWGLALSDQPGIPTRMGFDSFFGYLNQRKAHSYYPTYLWRNAEKILLPENEGHDHKNGNAYDAEGQIVVNGVPDSAQAKYSFDLYAAESLAFVREHKDEPFFLYLAYTPPHGALEVPELGDYAGLDWPSLAHKIWAAMITRMDTAIGRLMALLEELGLDDETLVFFTSDNGYSAAGYAKNPTLDDFFGHRGPWKGAKGDLHQGGLRVPALARWPGRIQPGSESDLIWAFWDFLPTAAEAAGGSVPPHIDGISILPTLLGRPGSQQSHEYLYWEHHDEQAARIGDWWAHRAAPDKPIGIYEAATDPQEARDLSASRPEVAARAERIFSEARTVSPYVRNPGESVERWEARLQAAGLELPDNVDG
ncbi:MAG: arylsulfatase [Kiritimatiellae bacterium]|nr:arylsulfatase [Kiritimatiellia bacterium]